MESVKLTLTIPEPILTKLKQEKENYGYKSLQEVIINMLREKFYSKTVEKAEKELRGRPRKLDEEKLLTLKKLYE